MDPNLAQIDLNIQFKAALDLLENSKENLFITGKAGTGKSTLLDYFRNHTKKNVVVLAPTGVAALNIKGQTIHSFFGFKPSITPEAVERLNPTWSKAKLYQKLETLVIDEISMVRADLLDCIDTFLRLNGPKKEQPFGGVQMVFIGDLFQLPPVTKNDEKEVFDIYYSSPYFFSARCMKDLPVKFLELQKIYRQDDQSFINLLNAVRTNTVTLDQLKLLNNRYLPEFEILEEDHYVYLTTTNKMAEEINNHCLKKIDEAPRVFEGSLWGEFEESFLPTSLEITLKKGAQVMMLNNDQARLPDGQAGRWVNGTIGQVVELPGKEEEIVLVKMEDGRVEEVSPFTWEIYKFRFDEENQSLVSEVVGAFTQYPLKLAWAVTIHKSQGKTFDKVIIDLGWGTFAHGQMYVALSRCRSLEGIVLKTPILKRHIIVDAKVTKFFQNLEGETVKQKYGVEFN